jgi:hypothetical protein
MKRKALLCFLFILLATAFSAVAFSGAMADSAKWPASSGKGEKKNGKMQLDVTNISEGYFMAKVQKKNTHKLKLRVVKGKESLTYDLNGSGNYEVFPLQLGNGKYEISLWENVSGKKYSSAGKLTITVKLKDENAPYLYPNQYVHYTKDSEAVKQAAALCKDKDAAKSFDAVKKYMATSFVYDFVKAVTIKSGMLPDVDGSFKKKMGVCQDLAAITACMLRTQGIPCRLMIGYADSQYHAWTISIVNKKEEFFDPTAALNAISKPKNYTVERYY